jgi:hypothetical protein
MFIESYMGGDFMFKHPFFFFERFVAKLNLLVILVFK